MSLQFNQKPVVYLMSFNLIRSSFDFNISVVFFYFHFTLASCDLTKTTISMKTIKYDFSGFLFKKFNFNLVREQMKDEAFVLTSKTTTKQKKNTISMMIFQFYSTFFLVILCWILYKNSLLLVRVLAT